MPHRPISRHSWPDTADDFASLGVSRKVGAVVLPHPVHAY
jgi:hypothetical protein